MRKPKQILAWFLCGTMLSLQTMVPVLAAPASKQGGLCEHHTAHTAECGYLPAAPGSPCTHVHDDDCYRLVRDCVHTHTEECYPEPEEDPVATPAVSKRRRPVDCVHECSEEEGCIREKLNCRHVHDDVCGYQPEGIESPCTFVCDICTSLEEMPKEETCTCSVLCTADGVDADCAVCGGEDGDLAACLGAEPEEAALYALPAVDPMNVYTYKQYSNADTSGNGSELFPYNRFEDAMANVADGGTIYIIDKGFINGKDNNETFVFDKAVTVRPAPGYSGSLLVRSAGLALGADVTIEDIELSLTSKVRAGIYANGHELTLSNIKRGAGARKIHLYAGGAADMADYAGSNGSIILKGSGEYGSIFGGGLEMPGGDVSIQIDNGIKMESIYACGSDVVKQSGDDLINPVEPPDPVANPDYASGNVTIDLINGQTAKVIEGTGADSVRVTVSPVYPSSMILKDITDLNIPTGTVMARTLTGSRGGINVELGSGAILDMTSLTALPALGTLNSSDGMFALKQDGCLTVDTFTGSAKLLTEGYFSGRSGRVQEGHTYLTVANSASDGVLGITPDYSQPNIVMKRKGNDWVAENSKALPSQVKLSIQSGQQDVTAASPMDVLEISAVAQKSGRDGSKPAGNNEMRLLLNGQPLETKSVDSNGEVHFSPVTVLPSAGFVPGENTISVEYGGGDIPQDLQSSSARQTLTVEKIQPELQVTSAGTAVYDGQSHIPAYKWVCAQDKAELPQELLPGAQDITFAAYTQDGVPAAEVILPGKYQLSWTILPSANWVKEGTYTANAEIISAVPVLSASYKVTDQAARSIQVQVTAAGVSGGMIPSGNITVKTVSGIEQTQALSNGTAQINLTLPTTGKTNLVIEYHETVEGNNQVPVYSDVQIQLEINLPEQGGSGNNGGNSENNGGGSENNGGNSENNGGGSENNGGNSENNGSGSGGSSGGGSSSGGSGSSGGGGSSSGGSGGSGGGGSSSSGSGSSKGPGNTVTGSRGDAAHGGSGAWEKDERGWRYKYADGAIEIGHVSAETNQEQVAWQHINGNWWAFGSDGYLKNGWVLDQSSNKWYWNDENTGMQKGWQFINNKWYYFSTVENSLDARPYGSMYQNEKTPDGYFVTADGSWDGNSPAL